MGLAEMLGSIDQKRAEANKKQKAERLVTSKLFPL
jgi:hypothetical protein